MTVVDEDCRIFENVALRQAGEGLIRPGGLALTRKAVSMAALPAGSRVLDLGCGTGVSLQYLKESCGLLAFGIDASAVLLAEGKIRNPGLDLARASGMQLPVADAAVDAVLAECSLSVMEDVEEALKECSRVLKNGGMLLIHDVYARSPGGYAGLQGLPVRCCLTGAVSKDEWIARVESRGFEVAAWEDQSVALKEFAARLIFSQGSLDAFWCGSRSGAGREGAKEIQRVVSSAKPGYFLLMARKTGGAFCKE